MVSKICTLTRRLFFVGAIVVWSAALAMGQLAGGLTESTNTRLGGNNYIVGTVYTPEGLPIKTRMRIKLASMEWGDILATTDENAVAIQADPARQQWCILALLERCLKERGIVDSGCGTHQQIRVRRHRRDAQAARALARTKTDATG